MSDVVFQGQVVGHVDALGVFWRRVKANQVLRRPPAIALHREVLAQLDAVGCRSVAFEMPDGTLLTGPVSLYRDRPVLVNRGWGEQVGVLLADLLPVAPPSDGDPGGDDATAGADEGPVTGACPKVQNRAQGTDRPEPGGSLLRVWSDGQAVQVTRPGAWSVPAGRQCTATRADGQRCQGRAVKDGTLCPVHLGGGRGKVTVMSDRSRLHLMHTLATIRRDRDALLVTVTWPTWAAPDRVTWHKEWDRLRARLARQFPTAGGIWRREFTKAGVVHLHLLLYGVAYGSLRSWLPAEWADCVDAPDRELREKVGSSVEEAQHWRAAQEYIAKYCSKRNQTTAQPYGRWWGVFGRENIPWAEEVTAEIDDRVAQRMQRTGRKWIDAQRRKRGIHVRRLGSPYGMTLLTADPVVWARLAALYGAQEDQEREARLPW